MGFKIHIETDGLHFGSKTMEKQLDKINSIANCISKTASS